MVVVCGKMCGNIEELSEWNKNWCGSRYGPHDYDSGAIFLQGYYKDICVCVIVLKFIGFYLNKHIIDILNFNAHPGAQISWGVPLFWVMPKFKSLFKCVLPKLNVCFAHGPLRWNHGSLDGLFILLLLLLHTSNIWNSPKLFALPRGNCTVL